MVRIAGIDLPREKRVEIGLTYTFGIGRPIAQETLDKTGIDYNIRVGDLAEAEKTVLRDEIDRCTVEGDLRRDAAMNTKRLREINCYRGIRHRRGLPVHGQKTKTNARIRKGSKKLVTEKK